MEPVSGDDRPHLPPPSLWPVGFAVGIACVLVGLIVSPKLIVPIGVAIALVFGFLWARDATRDYRGHVPDVEPERRETEVRETARGAPPLPAHYGEAAMPEPEPGEIERFPRSRFLEATTLGLGGLIGAIVTIPVLGPAIAEAFVGQGSHDVDLGPLSKYPQGQWSIATFLTQPEQGDVTRRTAYIRNNGQLNGEPSFTIISNRCAHLGCPVQANGPTLGKTMKVKGANGVVTLVPTQPAGFGCPCHGGQYDTEGNRTAGPPVRALDRYNYAIRGGRLILLKPFSVAHVDGQGAQARIQKFTLTQPGNHVDDWEAWLYPVQAPH